VVWNYATFLASKGIALLTTLVLARLLAPEDFGLIALALVVMNALDAINELGIGAAVIWRTGDEDETSDVAFVLSLASGLTLTAVAVLCAPLVADAVGEESVEPIIAALAVTLIIASFGSVQDARLRRALAFQRRFVAELLKALVKAGVTVALAIAGLGAWALVHGQVAGVAAGAACYWVLAGWRPRRRFDTDVARRLLGYGGQVTLHALLLVAVTNVDYLIIGSRLGTEALGYYTLAFRLPGLLIMSGCWVLSQVLFPAFANVTRDHGSLSTALLKTVRATTAVIAPLGVGIVLVAPDLVSVLFGERWAPAVPVLRWLAVFAVLSTLLSTDDSVYKARGRPGVMVGVTFTQLVVGVPLLWWAAGSGIEAVAMAQVALAAAVLALRVVLVRVLLAVRLRHLFAAVAPVAGGVVALVVAVALVQRGLVDTSPSIRLLASVLGGGLAYLAALAVVDRPWVEDMLRLFGIRQPSGRVASARATSAVP
jgi:PST family polysaccharide transporter